MMFHTLPIGMMALACLGVAGCSSDSTSESPGIGADAAFDAPAAEKQCTLRGGTRQAGVPDSTVPGYMVACAPGFTLADGTTSLTSGGNDIIQSSLALGCSRNADGTGTPALCCFPADAGVDDSAVSGEGAP